ncbi:uncharacterized protein LOC115548848 isoform X1 [Gadus morhua]|uniref:uncharacterized protein LOC115548848 isoform X1 n=1 Tax=Gadus morhua TaxID=8049 RepID=UPI0011B6CFBA|nr:uncharacterized protein LOC115548848 isoform X1 [Gadus morhua]
MYLCSVFLHALYFLNYWFVALQGSELNLSTVFLLKGNDLFMELQTQKPAGQLTWQFKKIRILRHNPKGDTQNFYGTRAEFSTNNYSLQIKNVGLNDSGLYEALDISGQKDEVIAGYHVTVQEQVSPVLLNVSSVSPSPESCNVTVTCSTQSSSLNSTFTCTPRTCSEDGGDPEEVVTSDARLNLYLSNGLIGICNHSNKVSWSNDTMEIKPLCFKDGMNAISSPRVPLIIISSCLVGIIMAMCTLGICYCKWTKNNHPTDNRETHSPGSEDQSPNCDQSPTVYSMLGPSSLPLEPIPPQTASPESIYAQVDKHGRV